MKNWQSICRQKAHLQSKSTEYNIKNNSESMGLGSYWGEVLDVLQEIIPVYD